MPTKYDQDTKAKAIRLVRGHGGDYETALITLAMPGRQPRRHRCRTPFPVRHGAGISPARWRFAHDDRRILPSRLHQQHPTRMHGGNPSACAEDFRLHELDFRL